MGKKLDGREVVAALLEVSAGAELGLAEDSVRTEVRKPLVASVDVASAAAASVVLPSVAVDSVGDASVVDGSVKGASVAVVSSATELGKAESLVRVVFEGITMPGNPVIVEAAEVTSVESAEDTADASRVADVGEIGGIGSLVVVSKGAASSTA